MKIRRLTARIITGSKEYTKELQVCEKDSSIRKLTFESMKQLESEQYLKSKGFK